MKHRKLVLLLVAVVLLCTGCSNTVNKEETPITITVWHVYGGQTDSPLNDLIDEFNQTVGKEQQINVQVTSVSNTNTIHELVLAAANGEPGASELPDLFISYPKTVMALPDDSILVDYRDYFSQEELSAFLPAFLEEGTVNDRLVVLPVAKSTEIMFINQTIFDRFSQATGVTIEESGYMGGALQGCGDLRGLDRRPDAGYSGDAKSMFVHDYYLITSRWGRNLWARISSRVTSWPLAPHSRRRGSRWPGPRFGGACGSRAVMPQNRSAPATAL